MPRTARILANVVPAYVMPAVMSYASALVLADHRLAAAAFGAIAVPSALAALAVTLWPVRRGRLVRVLVAAVSCAAVAFAATWAAVHSGLAEPALILDAVPSAVLGGVITALRTPNGKKNTP